MKLQVRREVPGVGAADIRLEVYEEEGVRVCAVDQLDGTINLRPKAWLSLIRGELQVIEGIAREAGCAEMRMAGRFTQHMLPDYQPYTTLGGDPALRKAL